MATSRSNSSGSGSSSRIYLQRQQHTRDNQKSSVVHNVDFSFDSIQTPLQPSFQLPQRQLTMWEQHPRQQQQQQHYRRASEGVQPQQRNLLSQSAFPYQPILGTQPIPSSHVDSQVFIVEPDEDPMQHLVLLPLGKTGAGKSSLLNLIFGYNEFKAKAAAKSVTEHITERTGVWTVDGSETIITVADTPGFADSMQRDEVFTTVFQKYISDLGHRLGVDSFMLIFQCDSSTNNIMAILDHFNTMMSQRFSGNSWWKYTLLVFTRVDYYPNLKLPPNILSKKQSISDVLIKDIEARYNLTEPLKYAFISSKDPTCSYNKKGQCDCFAAAKYHLDQMRTLRSRVNAMTVENDGRWRPNV